MKLNKTFEQATALTFIKVDGKNLTALTTGNELVTLEIADGELPKGTVVGSKLVFAADGKLTESSNPDFKPAVKTGRTGCLEQRIQG